MGMNEIDELVTNSLNKNQFLSMGDRDLFKSIIKDCAAFFDVYNVELNYDNLSFLLENLKPTSDESIKKMCSYDYENNEMLINKNWDAVESEVEKSYIKVILSVISNSNQIEMLDDSSDIRPVGGLIFNLNGMENGAFLDSRIKDRIIELIYGNDGIYTLPTVSDEVLGDIQKVVGIENILTWFVNGRGDLLFENLSSKIGSEQTEDLYKTMDEYEKTDINDMRELRRLESKYEKIRSESFINVEENLIAM